MLCMIKEMLEKILAAIDDIRASNSESTAELLKTLCDKMEVLEEKLCGDCPRALLEPFAASGIALVKGDRVAEFTVGKEVDLLNEAGASIGKATVATSRYDAEADATSLQLNPVEVEDRAAVKSVKVAFVSEFPIVEKEAPKEATVVAPTR